MSLGTCSEVNLEVSDDSVSEEQQQPQAKVQINIPNVQQDVFSELQNQPSQRNLKTERVRKNEVRNQNPKIWPRSARLIHWSNRSIYMHRTNNINDNSSNQRQNPFNTNHNDDFVSKIEYQKMLKLNIKLKNKIKADGNFMQFIRDSLIKTIKAQKSVPVNQTLTHLEEETCLLWSKTKLYENLQSRGYDLPRIKSMTKKHMLGILDGSYMAYKQLPKCMKKVRFNWKYLIAYLKLLAENWNENFPFDYTNMPERQWLLNVIQYYAPQSPIFDRSGDDFVFTHTLKNEIGKIAPQNETKQLHNICMEKDLYNYFQLLLRRKIFCDRRDQRMQTEKFQWVLAEKQIRKILRRNGAQASQIIWQQLASITKFQTQLEQNILYQFGADNASTLKSFVHIKLDSLRGWVKFQRQYSFFFNLWKKEPWIKLVDFQLHNIFDLLNKACYCYSQMLMFRQISSQLQNFMKEYYKSRKQFEHFRTVLFDKNEGYFAKYQRKIISQNQLISALNDQMSTQLNVIEQQKRTLNVLKETIYALQTNKHHLEQYQHQLIAQLDDQESINNNLNNLIINLNDKLQSQINQSRILKENEEQLEIRISEAMSEKVQIQKMLGEKNQLIQKKKQTFENLWSQHDNLIKEYRLKETNLLQQNQIQRNSQQTQGNNILALKTKLDSGLKKIQEKDAKIEIQKQQIMKLHQQLKLKQQKLIELDNEQKQSKDTKLSVAGMQLFSEFVLMFYTKFHLSANERLGPKSINLIKFSDLIQDLTRIILGQKPITTIQYNNNHMSIESMGSLNEDVVQKRL